MTTMRWEWAGFAVGANNLRPSIEEILKTWQADLISPLLDALIYIRGRRDEIFVLVKNEELLVEQLRKLKISKEMIREERRE